MNLGCEPRTTYECFEPDPSDEFYDQMCTAAYSRLFSEGVDYSAQDCTEYDSCDISLDRAG